MFCHNWANSFRMPFSRNLQCIAFDFATIHSPVVKLYNFQYFFSILSLQKIWRNSKQLRMLFITHIYKVKHIKSTNITVSWLPLYEISLFYIHHSLKCNMNLFSEESNTMSAPDPNPIKYFIYTEIRSLTECLFVQIVIIMLFKCQHFIISLVTFCEC